jgi:hypothetical protein
MIIIMMMMHMRRLSGPQSSGAAKEDVRQAKETKSLAR